MRTHLTDAIEIEEIAVKRLIDQRVPVGAGGNLCVQLGDIEIFNLVVIYTGGISRTPPAVGSNQNDGRFAVDKTHPWRQNGFKLKWHRFSIASSRESRQRESPE